jgi:hypothetical protein
LLTLLAQKKQTSEEFVQNDNNLSNRGWVTLAEVLPSLPALEVFNCKNSSLDAEAAKSLVGITPLCSLVEETLA